MNEKIKKIIWLLVLGAVFFSIYPFANWLAGERGGATNVQFNFENYIPFVPQAIVVYLGIFPYIIISAFLIKDYKSFKNAVFALIAIIFSSAFIFVLFPTTMSRPDVSREGIIGFLFWALRKTDGSYNLLPSLHVGTVVLISSINYRLFSKTRIFGVIISVLISISTLFVKQHAILDIFTGALFGFFIYYFFFKYAQRRGNFESIDL